MSPRDGPEEPHPPLALPPAQQGLSPECGWLEGCGGVAWLTSPVPSAEVRFPPVEPELAKIEPRR